MRRCANASGQAAVEAVVGIPMLAFAAVGIVAAASFVADGLAVSGAAHDAGAQVVAGAPLADAEAMLPEHLAAEVRLSGEGRNVVVTAQARIAEVVPFELPELRTSVAVEGDPR